MADLTDLQAWFFRGLAVNRRLDDLERDGLAVQPDSSPSAVQRVLPLEDFSPHVRRDAISALPAYLAFFCLENAVRELVAERLAETKGSDWWRKCASTTMRDRVEKRQAKEGKNRWHAQRGAHEVNYTDFGDLKNLIVAHWEDFQDLFPDQNWLTSRFDELENSRNIIAHSNVLDEREVDRLRLYLTDWYRQVG